MGRAPVLCREVVFLEGPLSEGPLYLNDFESDTCEAILQNVFISCGRFLQ